MADNVIEETENYLGKDELNWGYEEGKDSVREWLANSTLCETWNFIVIPMIRNYYKNKNDSLNTQTKMAVLFVVNNNHFRFFFFFFEPAIYIFNL